MSSVLIVDDDRSILRVIARLLRAQGYDVIEAYLAADALALAVERQPDLILLDVLLPDQDGFDVCRQLRADPRTAEVPVVFITALDDRASRIAGLEAGGDDVLYKPIDQLELLARVRTITRLNRYRLLIEERRRAESVAVSAALELARAYDATLDGWARALDLRDHETEGHSRRVTVMTVRLARAWGICGEELMHIRRGALLHDIGKLGVPDAILRKPGSLDDDEWLVMRMHPVYAYEWLASIDYLRPALDIPYAHHERWDGSGYPRGLRGLEIPLAARLFAVVDVWDALRSERPYRPGWSAEQIVTHLASLAGIHFDPEVVRVFLSLEPWTWQDAELRDEAEAEADAAQMLPLLDVFAARPEPLA
jgi:putative two-component system response regulator